MKLFDIYTWATGKQASFLNNFNGNDQLYAQAQQFWNTLESNAITPHSTINQGGIIIQNGGGYS